MTLKFFHEIEGNEVVDGTGIGIVEYVYENAKEHFAKMERIKKNASKSPFENSEKTVYTMKPKKRQHKKYIDIEGLLHG